MSNDNDDDNIDTKITEDGFEMTFGPVGCDADHPDLPAEEWRQRFVAMLTTPSLGIVMLKHKATGEQHCMICARDPENGNIYPVGRLLENTKELVDAYEVPAGANKVGGDTDIDVKH